MKKVSFLPFIVSLCFFFFFFLILFSHSIWIFFFLFSFLFLFLVFLFSSFLFPSYFLFFLLLSKCWLVMIPTAVSFKYWTVGSGKWIALFISLFSFLLFLFSRVDFFSSYLFPLFSSSFFFASYLSIYLNVDL